MAKNDTGYTIFATAWGNSAIAWRDNAITKLVLPEKNGSNFELRCAELCSDYVESPATDRVDRAVKQIQKYFIGEKYDFKKIKLDLTDSSAFAQRVYHELQKIEPGCTVSYKDLAEKSGSANASRAVGSAVAHNPLPLLIPCHRVVNADGRIGGFSAGGGIKLKEQLLRHEGVSLTASEPVRLAKPPLLSETNIDAAIKFLSQKDPDLGKIIKIAPRFNLKCDALTSPFQALLEAIVYQQLTGKAAATIYTRVLRLFSANDTVAPLDIIRANDEELRSAGLSGSKVAAIRDLAEFATSGRLPDLETLYRMPDKDIINALTQIRGIGRWTVEMLLIFKLGRADILAADDYGLRKGFAIIKKSANLPTPKELALQTLCWQPFRSIASWYLWRASEMGKISA